MFTDDWLNDIHRRLLREDPTAPSELSVALLKPIISALSKRYKNLGDPHLIEEAAADAILSYVKSPTKFDPSRRKLFGYLIMSAEGDLKNSLAKAKRRSRKEIPTENVELGIVNGNEIAEEPATSDHAVSHELLNGIVDSLFDKPLDRELAKMMLNGERSTERFSKAMGLDHMPAKEQRAEVKRNKDRIKKRLERFSEDLSGRTE